MLRSRGEVADATRSCPHCKAMVLARSSVCPGCGHHLRFNAPGTVEAQGYLAFQMEGSLRHVNDKEAAEYCIVLTVENAAGQTIARQVVNVGSLKPAEARTVRFAVEMFPAAKT